MQMQANKWLTPLGLITDAAVAGRRDEMRASVPKNYEFTIRMADRSHRLVNDENSAIWRRGERVVVIDSASPPTQ